MRRFTLPPDRLTAGRVTFDAGESRHLSRVVRLQPGDTVIATDGAGRVYVAGQTSATAFPTTAGAFQGNQPGVDGVVSKLGTEPRIWIMVAKAARPPSRRSRAISS